jgi:hypothetical protein
MASFIGRHVSDLTDSMELHYQKYLVNVFMIIGLPVLGIFAVYDFIVGRYLIGTLLLLMFALLVWLFAAINKPGYKSKESFIYPYFLNVLFILFGFFVAYTVGFEGNLSRMPWVFIFTVLVFFALGTTRALLLVSILFCALLALEFYAGGNARLVFISPLCWSSWLLTFSSGSRKNINWN